MVMLGLLSDHLFGFVESVGSQQIVDQPHQFTSCKRKDTFFGVFRRIRFLEAVVLCKCDVVHLDTLCGFREVVLQVAVTRLNNVMRCRPTQVSDNPATDAVGNDSRTRSTDGCRGALLWAKRTLASRLPRISSCARVAP
ncbi:hypothetical protein EI42_04375 [Thermosporothrix hazakensis]|uniref:Uncharacterized protein n=1 Tax=Thermosporothrix hazakensis TaxID=644383 RepID=A0A326U3H6_THEHA|nr:hypothetical protein EI42_04375 [Thermosporothrix hazakensis]